MTTHVAHQLPEVPDPNIPQREAAIPEYDVWVAASAGSGKTKVLTDRVLRLLLPDPQGRWAGAVPHKILCITFTKAAAALMALRVQKKLGEWAMMSEEDLYKDLSGLLGAPPSEEILKAAPKLFSTVLDVPSGLSIMTIHAFCQSVLGRFAIEAGVTPGFTVLEDARAHDLLRQIVDDLIRNVENGTQAELKDSFTNIATYMDLDSLRQALLDIMAKSRDVQLFLKSYNSPKKILDFLMSHLGFEANRTLNVRMDDLRYMAKLMTEIGTKTDSDGGQGIADWLALNPEQQIAALGQLQNSLVTKKDKSPRKVGKKITENHPEFFEKREAIINEIADYCDNQLKAQQAQQTRDLMMIVSDCLTRYTARKREINALDFNDLILKTRKLLESEDLDWVQYKLDEGIDHILVDEAQDTNIHQWKIIEYLSKEFLSGIGNDNRLRSLFVVGDEKQSIFSFHGADPEAFQVMRDFFARRSQEAGRTFKPIQLETSFRSARPILHLVDTVFAAPALAKRLGLPDSMQLTHFANRDKVAGRVELWEPILKNKPNTKDTDYAWSLPISDSPSNETTSTSSPLAAQIAITISKWLESGEKLESTGQKIEPRDILVLVRTRTPFVPDLVRQLKIRGVPVSGVDRMKLTEQIAVMDCLALARFARLPSDDLSLACLLKSPFIRLSEEELMNLALGRKGSLWDEVQKKSSATLVTWLQNLIDMSRRLKPFDMFDLVLNQTCPYKGGFSGWRAFATCLGEDCLDPLEEFLSYCLTQEENGIFSLEELVSVLGASNIEIKRDSEDADKDSVNQVRIMTVHASKGLEAPIVFLPDTMSVPSRGKIDALQWSRMDASSPAVPIWAAKSEDGCSFYQDLKDSSYDRALSEHLRLLYVALTRPRDRLYIMGETSSVNWNDLCWYKLVYDAFEAMSYKQMGTVKCIESSQTEAPNNKDIKGNSTDTSVILPEWITKMAPEDSIPSLKTIQPSRLLGEEDFLVRSPLDAEASFPALTNKVSQNRFLRGTLTHKLFQILPDIPADGRENAARQFLERMGQQLSAVLRDEIIIETLKILNGAEFADVFGPNSMAEVPVSGALGDGRMISGQIDRLVIGHNKVLIVDFKTNRPSPRDENAIPESYKNQLKAYKTALSKIFPDKEIHCALLWTDQPLLMPVSV